MTDAIIEQTPAEATVRRFIDGINRHESRDLGRMMTPNHSMQVLDGLPLVGRQPNVVNWERYFAANPAYTIHVAKVATRGIRVAVLGHTTGSHLKLPDAQEAGLPVVWLAEVVGPLLKSWRILPAGAPEQTELLGAPDAAALPAPLPGTSTP